MKIIVIDYKILLFVLNKISCLASYSFNGMYYADSNTQWTLSDGSKIASDITIVKHIFKVFSNSEADASELPENFEMFCCR